MTHRFSPSHRTALAAVGTLLALSGLTACGDDRGAGTATDAIKVASSSTSTSADPDTVAPGDEIDAEKLVALFTTAVEQSTSARVTLEQTGSGLSGEGVVDYGSDPVAVEATATLASMGDVELRLVDNVAYVQLPMLGDKFVAFDLDDAGNPLGDSLTHLVDADTLLTAVAAGIDSATYVGEEDVDGEAMDHYSVVADPSALLDDLDLPEGAPPVDLPDGQVVDVWFDQDGFFRKVVTDLDRMGTTTLTFDDWGSDVSVEAPPSDQVTSMPGVPSA